MTDRAKLLRTVVQARFDELRKKQTRMTCWHPPYGLPSVHDQLAALDDATNKLAESLEALWAHAKEDE